MVCREILQQGWHFPLGNTRLSNFHHMKILPNIVVAVIAVGVGVVLQFYYQHLLRLPSPVLNTVTVRGDSPSAPVPMAVDLQLHKDGSVTWKKP